MTEVVKQAVSISAEKQLNKGRKRKINIHEWKDNKNKALRNAGKPYMSRKGHFVPGKCVSEMITVCRCHNQCGEILPDMKKQLFQNFYKLTYDEQSRFLVGCMTLEEVKRREVEENISRRHATFKYKLCTNGKTYNVCKKTLLDVFNISSRRVQTLQLKIKNNLDVSDMRGKHFNRPHAVTYDVKQLVRNHIESMPAEESHYSRSVSQKRYISLELSLEKMYDLFKETNPSVKCSRSIYRDIFRSEFKLRFGAPRSDSCAYCDEMYIQLVTADTEELEKKITAQSTLHHMKAEGAYRALQDDVEIAKNTEYVVLCKDMQQVLFCPTLHHSSVFYQRQFATYNQGIHNMGEDTAFFFVWNESVAKKGSSEVTSCILKYTQLHFQPLKPDEKKRLVAWSDRCIGQNNNWRCLALYHYLIRNKYFTTIDQTFLFKVCHGSLYAVMWLADEPREFNLPTLPQRRITYVPEKLPSKYGVHSEEYVPIRTRNLMLLIRQRDDPDAGKLNFFLALFNIQFKLGMYKNVDHKMLLLLDAYGHYSCPTNAPTAAAKHNHSAANSDNVSTANNAVVKTAYYLDNSRRTANSDNVSTANNAVVKTAYYLDNSRRTAVYLDKTVSQRYVLPKDTTGYHGLCAICEYDIAIVPRYRVFNEEEKISVSLVDDGNGLQSKISS
ncbi:hypothetical protein ANN_18571 [Periplaneta americana]|uniref:Uncharacterized protein n=1 Tax=Periplaneta americana TaxID=6978 RepID=A0ABQ8SPS8_PERAM|nr:hypothetical protein ANN_18571 [Periplaneta americana]